MVFLSLQNRTFREVHLKMDIREQTKLEIESAFAFNVNYMQDNTGCVALLRQEVKLKDAPEQFNIVVEAVGQFTCQGVETLEDKKQAHVQCYILLFPYVQNMIAQLSTEAGMPPLMVEMSQMDPKDVTFQDEEK